MSRRKFTIPEKSKDLSGGEKHCNTKREGALFYLDPPYVGTECYYNVPFTAEDHHRLASVLQKIKGQFILSYNDCSMIRDLYSWCTVESIVRNTTLAGNSDNKIPFAEVIVKNF